MSKARRIKRSERHSPAPVSTPSIRPTVVAELAAERGRLIVAVEKNLSPGAHGNEFVAKWKTQIEYLAKRITDLGGVFEPWEFP